MATREPTVSQWKAELEKALTHARDSRGLRKPTVLVVGHDAAVTLSVVEGVVGNFGNGRFLRSLPVFPPGHVTVFDSVGGVELGLRIAVAPEALLLGNWSIDALLERVPDAPGVSLECLQRRPDERSYARDADVVIVALGSGVTGMLQNMALAVDDQSTSTDAKDSRELQKRTAQAMLPTQGPQGSQSSPLGLVYANFLKVVRTCANHSLTPLITVPMGQKNAIFHHGLGTRPSFEVPMIPNSDKLSGPSALQAKLERFVPLVLRAIDCAVSHQTKPTIEQAFSWTPEPFDLFSAILLLQALVGRFFRNDAERQAAGPILNNWRLLTRLLVLKKMCCEAARAVLVDQLHDVFVLKTKTVSDVVSAMETAYLCKSAISDLAHMPRESCPCDACAAALEHATKTAEHLAGSLRARTSHYSQWFSEFLEGLDQQEVATFRITGMATLGTRSDLAGVVAWFALLLCPESHHLIPELLERLATVDRSINEVLTIILVGKFGILPTELRSCFASTKQAHKLLFDQLKKAANDYQLTTAFALDLATASVRASLPNTAEGSVQERHRAILEAADQRNQDAISLKLIDLQATNGAFPGLDELFQALCAVNDMMQQTDVGNQEQELQNLEQSGKVDILQDYFPLPANAPPPVGISPVVVPETNATFVDEAF